MKCEVLPQPFWSKLNFISIAGDLARLSGYDINWGVEKLKEHKWR